MPIPDLGKPAGKRCEHLCANGCGIYADRPEVCRTWYCTWREDAWFGARAEYRPDRLGAMFSHFEGAMSVWEVKPGALNDRRVDYIKKRLRQKYKVPRLRVNRYPLHVLDHVNPTAEDHRDPEKRGWIGNR
jgi:hypothetical protein